jgi:hypothetical protein
MAVDDQRQATGRAIRLDDDARRDPGGGIPAIDPRAEERHVQEPRAGIRGSANAIAVSAPLPARSRTKSTASGRYASVRTTGWGAP